jgi:hypothetical protein
MSVYENRRVLPRAWLVHEAEAETSSERRIQILSQAGFPASRVALLSAPLQAAQPLPSRPSQDGGDSATILRYLPEAVEIQTASSQASLLVLADQAFPGWQVEVDAQRKEIVTVDHALRGVYLEPGSHLVRFGYFSSALAVGAILSAAALLLCAFLLLRSMKTGAIHRA